MKYKIYLILFISIFLSSCGETKDYYSLEEDKKLIGGVLSQHDVVILGESIHDSENIFNQKVNLMKHLVENEGFNLIMLEGSEAELEYYKDKDYAVQEGLNHVYRQENFRYFFENEQLETSQIDWLPLVYETPTYDTQLLHDIYTEVSEFDNESAAEFKSTEIALRTWTYEMLMAGNPEKYNRSGNIYQTIMEAEYFEELSHPAQKYIDTKNYNLINYILEIDFNHGYVEYNEMRSKGMADSIINKLNNDTKALIWIHNGYAQYAPQEIQYTKQTSYNYEGNLETVGNILREEGIDVYTVGLIFNEASSEVSPYFQSNIERKTDDNFIEGYIGNQLQDNIFIDFTESDFIKNETYKFDELGTNEYVMNPLRQYDGLIYLDKIEK